MSQRRDMEWLYIGSHNGLSMASGVLQISKRLFIGRDIESIVEAVRENFVDYIGKVSQLQKDRVLWYSSRVASKSMSQTSIFHQYVYQKLLEGIAQDETRDLLVVTDDSEFMHNVEMIAPENVRMLSRKIFIGQRMIEMVRGVRVVLRHLSVWIFWRSLRNKRVGMFDVFIHTWIDERAFKALPEFNDSYFGNLEQVLRSSGRKVARLGHIGYSITKINRLNRHFSNIIYPNSYLLLRDFFKAVFTRFKVDFADSLLGVDDVKVLDVLLAEEVKKENRSKKFLDYLLLYYSYKNLCRMINKKASFIYPFENQPWEKMFNLAYEKFNRIAYQHSTIPFNYLDYRVSRHENVIPLPRVILTTGKVWSSFLEKYYHNSTVSDAGAIRYRYLFGPPSSKAQRNENTHKTIVVTLPIKPTIAMALQRHLLDALSETDLSEYIIRIKPHLYLPRSAQLRDDFERYENCRFTDAGMDKLLSECDLLITTGSAVAYESVISGVKTLYFIPEEISFGNEHFIREHIFVSYEDNFKESLIKALGSQERPKARIEEYFSQPDYSKFLKYVEGETL